MHSGFAALEGWTEVSASSKDVLTDVEASSTFPSESLSDVFWFVQSALPGEHAIREEEGYTLWNPIFNFVLRVMMKKNIDIGTA